MGTNQIFKGAVNVAGEPPNESCIGVRVRIVQIPYIHLCESAKSLRTRVIIVTAPIPGPVKGTVEIGRTSSRTPSKRIRLHANSDPRIH